MADNNNNNLKGTNVQVAVRCRPLNQDERRGNQPTVVSCDNENRMIKINYGPVAKKIQKTYTFDRVFGMYSTQEEVFQTMVLPIVDETLTGFNCTIFAYGQTGTGKTHTMEGDIFCPENAGIVPRSVKAILEKLESTGAEFTIRVSFLELYNEELQDLLATDTSSNSDDKGRLRLCEDAKKGVICQNLEEITVLSVNDIFDILQRGIRQRQTAETLCNKNSSRSHTIFTMKIMIKETNVEGEEVVRHGQLNLVDLAGSECVGRSGAKNVRAREAGNINQSLLTLGRVITALVDHHGHIPYRDSKLTRLLQESLGGKAKTCIIATLSPSQGAIEETLSTLDYAYRAKSIKNIPQINQKMVKKVILKEYCAEIEALRQQLQITREKNGIYLDPVQFEQMENKLAAQEQQLIECEGALKSRQEEIKGLRTEVDSLQGDLDTLRADYEDTSTKLLETEENLVEAQKTVEYLTVEWKATEGVVKEQTTTEGVLQNDLRDLQDVVTVQDSDLKGLFKKIHIYQVKEEERISEISKYVENVNTHQIKMKNEIQATLENTTNESVSLCNDVSTLLVKGKEVNSVLKESIDAALAVLINDTSVTKEKMIESCNELQCQLGGTKESVIHSLTTLQSALSQWLGDVEAKMRETQSHLKQQQSQMHTAIAYLTTSGKEYSAISTEFLQRQQSNTKSVQQSLSDIRDDISSTFQKFQMEYEEDSRKQEMLMSQQSEKIQDTLQVMLKEMLSSNKLYLNHSQTSVNTMMSSLAQRSEESFKQCASDINELHRDVTITSNTLQNTVTQVVTSTQKSFEQSLVESKDIEIIVDQISSTAGDKRENLDSTLNEVSERISVSITAACNEVQATADVASSILEDVKKSSENMDHTVSNCLDDFSGYLDNQGDILKQELGSHFTSVQSFLSSQSEEISDVLQVNEEFLDQSRENIVRPTGSTPEKKQMKPLRDITCTRDHNMIKDEIRGAKRTLDCAYSEGDDAMDKSSSPQKSSRDTISNSSVHSGKTLSFDSEDSIPDENENSDPQNFPQEVEIAEPTSKGTMLPKLTRGRSAKLNKTPQIR